METPSNADFEAQYQARRAQEEADYTAKRVAEEEQARKDNEGLVMAQTVRFSVVQTNGKPIHLCDDGEWRTNEDISNLGKES